MLTYDDIIKNEAINEYIKAANGHESQQTLGDIGGQRSLSAVVYGVTKSWI